MHIKMKSSIGLLSVSEPYCIHLKNLVLNFSTSISKRQNRKATACQGPPGLPGRDGEL